MAGRQKKKRMGRPPIKNPRTRSIVVRVNVAELRTVERAAKAVGLTVAGYIRRRVALEE